jgi:putative molybdopterin biosynthesis protein
MPEYLSTREVARYLKLNEKKVYALAAEGRIPAARVTGKWLFPKDLVDRWVSEHTTHPAGGLMTALLDEALVVQGSDDWVLGRVVQAISDADVERPVLTSWSGSLAGLAALSTGHAHVASSHVAPEPTPAPRSAWHLSLFVREQGLLVPRRARRSGSLEALAQKRLRFAARQPRSGTALLVDRLLADAGLRPRWTAVGPFASHLEVALAVRDGRADAGVGIRIAAELAGVDFVPLAREKFDLVIPSAFMSHPRVSTFLDAVLTGVRREARRRPAGYAFDDLGRLQSLGPATIPDRGRSDDRGNAHKRRS